MTRIVDLSVSLAADHPCWWPELAPFAATPTYRLEDGGVASRSLRVEEHCGTHVDAPCHIADETGSPTRAVTLDGVPLDALCGRARVIDVRSTRGTVDGESPWIDADVLEAFESASGAVVRGDAVLLWSGWSDEHYRPLPDGLAYAQRPLAGETPGWPAPTGDFIEALADRGVTLIGVDTPTLGALQDTFTPHRAALRRGVNPVEGLTNLGAICGRAARFLFLPLPVLGATGAPGRAIAMLEDEPGHD
jgi:isatin hydrolase